MAKRWTTYLGIALTAATLGACAAKRPETSVTWKKSDGGTATAEELERAATACHEANRATRGDDTGRFATVEWAANMLDCMKERGFFRVEEPLP